MEFGAYQKEAKKTAVYPSIVDMVTHHLIKKGEHDLALLVKKAMAGSDLEGNIYYATQGLAGEAGEIANKAKKIMRDADGEILPETKEALEGELGDVIWYLAAVATELGLDLNEIASKNLDKLFSRKARGVLKGSGDTR